MAPRGIWCRSTTAESSETKRRSDYRKRPTGLCLDDAQMGSGSLGEARDEVRVAREDLCLCGDRHRDHRRIDDIGRAGQAEEPSNVVSEPLIERKHRATSE